jgi:hypothetical protein
LTVGAVQEQRVSSFQDVEDTEVGGTFSGGLDGAAPTAARSALQFAEVQPPLVGHDQLTVQDEGRAGLAECGGRRGDLGEGRSEVAAVARLDHDVAGAGEDDGPEPVPFLLHDQSAGKRAVRGQALPGFGEHRLDRRSQGHTATSTPRMTGAPAELHRTVRRGSG